MAKLAAKANGNLTASTTWGVIDETSYLNAENATESLLTTAYSGTRSSAFTPGAITIDGIGVKLCERLGTTGTMSVVLELDSDNSAVAGTEVTINVSDLPNVLEANADGGWIFFKFAAPVTLLAATAYQVAAKTSSANMVDLWCDGTADNISRYLRTTTEQAPAAGDDMVITSERTGTAAGNTITVTMNETAATDYGAASTSQITPAIAISKGGTLNYDPTGTALVLRVSGTVVVYSEGTLNIGTAGTPVARGSTAALEFDCAVDGDFGLVARNGSTVVAQGLSRTSGKNVVQALLNADLSATGTTVGVNADTGWLDGDEVAIASTTRTATQSEKLTLSGNAGASSFGTTAGAAAAHSGTSPTQAEVILITRNVQIRSVSTTAMTYIDVHPTATIDFDWVLIRYGGGTTANKDAFDLRTIATGGSVTLDFCAMSDCEGGIGCTGAAAGLVTINDMVFWNCSTATTTTGVIELAGAANYSRCTIVGSGASGHFGIIQNSTTGTFSSIVIAGCQTSATQGAYDSDSLPSANINGFTIHSCSGIGFRAFGFTSGGTSTSLNLLTITNLTIWRCSAAGIVCSPSATSSIRSLVFDTLTMFGNTTNNITVSTTGAFEATFKDFTSNGDTSFSTTNGISMRAPGSGSPDTILTFINSNLSQVTGIKTAHTTDIQLSTSSIARVAIEAQNTRFGGTTEVSNFSPPSSFSIDSYFASTFHDKTDLSHKTQKRYGLVQSDSTIHDGDGISERITPNSASNKVESSYKKYAVGSSVGTTVTVRVRESVVGDGTDYNGNRPRLILKRNDAAGFAADQVLATATGSAEGAWQTLTGTVAGTLLDCVIEVCVDCDGTTGWVNVDTWTAA